MTLLLSCMIAAAALGAPSNPADAATDAAIFVILKDRKLPPDQEAAVRKALAEAAAGDSVISKALVFSASATSLLNVAKKEQYDLIELVIDDPEGAVADLFNAMHKSYQGDGVLPGVRYQQVAAEPWDTWLLLEALFNAPNVEKYLAKYAELRGRGWNSVQAAERLGRVTDDYALIGADAIVRSLQGFGTRFLTGYQASDAMKDKSLFLEAWYASVADGEPGVTPADCPRRFIGNIALTRMAQDRARNMIPINRIINTELRKFEKKPEAHNDEEEDNEAIGMPGKTADPDGWIVAAVHPRDETHVNQVQRGGIRVWQSSWKPGHQGARIEIEFSIQGRGLNPIEGEVYEVAFLPWVKAENPLTIVPADEDRITSGRLRLLSNSLGQVETVILHVPVKRSGSLTFRICASSEYALSIGETYIRRVK